MESNVWLISGKEQQWRLCLQGDGWTVERALKSLQEAPDVSDSVKFRLFTEVLERELRIFSGELNIPRDRRFYTVRHCLAGIAKLDEVPLETRFDLLHPFLNRADLSDLRWHAIDALGHLAGLNDSLDRRRVDILYSIARGANPWHRVYAVEAMHNLTISLDSLMEQLRFNILYPLLHQEVVAVGKILLDKGVEPLRVLQFVLPVAHPDHPNWRMADVAFVELGKEVAKRTFVNYTLDVEGRSMDQESSDAHPHLLHSGNED